MASTRCRSGRLTFQPATAIGPPPPPVVVWFNQAGVVTSATSDGSQTFADAGGTVQLWFDDGSGPVLTDSCAWSDWLAFNILVEPTGASGTLWCIHVGGGVDFIGDSGQSNTEVVP